MVKIISTGTPTFPLEALKKKEVEEISEKIFTATLSKNLDNNY